MIDVLTLTNIKYIFILILLFFNKKEIIEREESIETNFIFKIFHISYFFVNGDCRSNHPLPSRAVTLELIISLESL